MYLGAFVTHNYFEICSLPVIQCYSQAYLEIETRRLILEEIADGAAIVEVVADAWLCVDAELWQGIVLQTQTASCRPLHAVFRYRLIYTVCIGRGLDVPVSLCASREIGTQASPLP